MQPHTSTESLVSLQNRQSTMSRTCVSNTGSPQGCAPLSAALYFAYRQSAGLLRSAVILLSFLMTLHCWLSRREQSRTAAVLSPAFVQRCGNNFLDLNVSKNQSSSGKATPFLVPALFTVKTSKLWPLWAPCLTPSLNGLSHTSSGASKEFLCGRKLVLLACARPVLCSEHISYADGLLTSSFICWFHGLSLKDRNSPNGTVKKSKNC